jgi:ATP-dependent RNA helicase DeaD
MERTEAAAPRPEAPARPAAPPSRVEPKPAVKAKPERPNRTGREAGKVAIFLNVGSKELITAADVVGKIAGVTRLPAAVVGAIDIHARHTLVDVAADQAEFILKKLTGIRVKGVALAPVLAGAETV